MNQMVICVALLIIGCNLYSREEIPDKSKPEQVLVDELKGIRLTRENSGKQIVVKSLDGKLLWSFDLRTLAENQGTTVPPIRNISVKDDVIQIAFNENEIAELWIKT